MTKSIFKFLFAAALFTAAVSAQVRLPKLISSGMVLQRDANVKIWGWAGAGEQVTLRFNDVVLHAAADSLGMWEMTLPTMSAGGPYTMTIAASDTVTVKNILVGDVWVCSGQSNMELPMSRVRPLYESDIARAENHDIRQFLVPQKYDFNHPQSDVQYGAWKAADPNTVLDFSATAYFFADEQYKKYHVPIGLINTSLGGSPAEAWMSEEALKKFPAQYAEAQKFKDTALIVRIDSLDKARSDEWYARLRWKDEGFNGGQKIWSAPNADTAGWAVMKIPGYWNSTALGPVNGVVWFRKEVMVPAAMAGRQATLILGRIVDADSVFVNGVFVGTTSYQYPPRRYDIPASLLKAGKNAIVVRVISTSGNGGFVPDKQYEIAVAGRTIDLKGEWRYRLGAVMEPLASQTFIRWKPLGLYNAMLSPLLKYNIKGVIWYQGESNAGRPTEYREIFPALIRDWRAQWNQGDFPFLYVQLPNFMETKPLPSESNWALLREAQLKTLSVPNTGMAVAIDIGEWNDIHPLNKKDVGRRLALAAEKTAYGETRVTGSGPIYRSMKVDRSKIVLSFSEIGGGLAVKGGKALTGLAVKGGKALTDLAVKGGKALTGFAIAGSDSHFVFAHAVIRKNTVVVWHEKITHPIAVRYAWADNPAGANLYNKEGLPASPFRTDEWPAK
jgi:sialate O-acetylesterase